MTMPTILKILKKFSFKNKTSYSLDNSLIAFEIFRGILVGLDSESDKKIILLNILF